MATTLRFLSGGAAAGLVGQLRADFEAKHNCVLQGTFGAVGLMKDKLLAGEPCDLLILTEGLIRELTNQGHAVAGSVQALGVVQTGLAVKQGAAPLQAATSDELKRVLQQAGAIYFPDPAKATAGIHFMKVLQALGIAGSHADRLRTFPNGATAMGALAQAPEAGAVGCTQVTEILHTPGVQLCGLLPAPHGLATVYTAAVCSQGTQRELAAALISALAGPAAAQARRDCGFE